MKHLPASQARPSARSHLSLCISAALLTGFTGQVFAADVAVSNNTEYQSEIANANRANSTITIKNSFTLTLNPTTTVNNLSLKGLTGLEVITANTNDRILQTIPADFANIRDLTFMGSGAVALGDGGAFDISGDLTGEIKNTTFSGFTVTAGDGGAVAIAGDMQGNIVNSVFNTNVATAGDGGALFVSGDMNGNISNSTFSSNTATAGDGGALFFAGDMNGNISNSTFANNTAGTGGAGGAVFITGDMNGNIVDTVFRSNTADADGGAIAFQSNGNALISGSTFIGNAATLGSGGALYAEGLKVSLVNSNFVSNTAGTAGGALYYDAATASPIELNITATTGSSSLFTGNGASAIRLATSGGATSSTVNVQADGNVYMFDPITNITATLATDVNKNGAGNWYLGGNSTIAGDSIWNINQGTFTLVAGSQLNLTNAAGGEFRVAQGATLAGQGTIAITATGLTDGIWIGGTLAPSLVSYAGPVLTAGSTLADIAAAGAGTTSNYGNMIFNSDATFEAGSVYEVDYADTGTGTDKITMSAGKTLYIDPAATLKVKPTGFTVGNNRIHQVIDTTAAGASINGTDTFGSILLPLFHDHNSAPSYTAAGLDLDIIRNADDFQGLGSTYNQTSLGAELDLITSDAVGSIAQEVAYGVYGATAAEKAANAQKAYDSLSGEIHASTRTAILGNQHLARAVEQRTQKASYTQLDDSSGQAWVSAWGFDGESKSNRNGGRNAATADQSGSGIAVGGESLVGSGLLLGALFGYEDAEVKVGSRSSKADIASYSLGTYAAADLGAVELSGALTYSKLDLDSKRSVQVGDNNLGNAKADYNGTKVQLVTEAAKSIAFSDELALSPYVNLSHTWLKTDAVTEKGAGIANLRVKGQNDQLTQTTIGVRPSWSLPGDIVAVNADLGWVHSFGDTEGETRNRFINGGGVSDFRTKGTTVDKNAAKVGAGLQIKLGEGASLGFDYQGQLGSDYKEHSGKMNLNILF